MLKSKLSIIQRLKSFKHAFNGLRIILKEEHNARIHLVATLVVIIPGLLLKLSNAEWLFIILVIGFVWAMELINSAIENLCDFVSPEEHHLIKKVKDLSAAGVLVSAVVALVMGTFIFFT